MTFENLCSKVKLDALALLGAAFKNVNDDGSQKNENSNFVDAMHHPEIDIGGFVGIGFLKYPYEIMTDFTKFKKFL